MRAARSARMSPLANLYRREVKRLRHRYPTLEPRDVDRMVTMSLAHAFLDVEAAEMAHAMADGNPSLRTQAAEAAAAYSPRTVAATLAIVAEGVGGADDRREGTRMCAGQTRLGRVMRRH